MRPTVLWRKGSFGCDSEAGSRFAERLLTVVASCHQQGRRLLDFLLAAVEAAEVDEPTPAPSRAEEPARPRPRQARPVEEVLVGDDVPF